MSAKHKQHPKQDDAREAWTVFALPPARLELPATWYPFLNNWTAKSAHVRWETLTGTPLELNWMWFPSDGMEPEDVLESRLAAAWKREIQAAEKQAKQNGLKLEWKGQERKLSNFLGDGCEGTLREYAFGEQAGYMAVLTRASGGRRIYYAAALSPPADTPEPLGFCRRLLRSMDVAGTGAPQRVELDGLRAELPADFALQGVRFSEAQLYLEFLSREAKLGLARLGFSDLHKGQLDETELQTRVMKMLFDRGEVTDPVSSAMMGPPRIFGPGVERAAGKTGRTGDDDVHRHPAGFYREKRRAHIRAGDWVVRKFGRRWSGGAAGLAWSCPETRALFAVCVRRGDEAAEAELRRFVETVRCHDAEAGKPVDWRPYVYAEAQLKPGARPKKEKLPDKGVRLSPLEMRRRQLRFRVRTQPEVRFEPSLKDETGSLIYPVRTGDGLVARVLRGGRPPETFHRRLALDPVGCKVWVGLADGPCVGELLADLSRDLGVHPVQLFPKLLAYLKMLGDRRLVDGVPDELAEPAPVAPAETASKAEN